MTVLQVCAFGAPSAGNFIAALTRLENTLREQGVETIYAFADTARDKTWCAAICRRTKVYFLPVAHARVRPKTYRMFRSIYRENEVSVVHSHFELYDIPASVMAPPRARIFWHLHDALKRNYQKAGWTRKLLTRVQYGVMGRRAQLLSVSLEHAEFARRLGFPRERIHYLPNGIDTDRIGKGSVTAERTQFLMFGWEVHRKGVDLLVEAARRLPELGCEILVIGQDACQTYLEQHPAPGVRFARPVSDINELYGHARAFLHISRAEGLSYALLEVIYAGIPVICSDIPENAFARRFKGVFFVPNGGAAELADAIRMLAETPGPLPAGDVAENRRIIEEHYSLRAWEHQMLRWYLEPQ